MGRLDRPNSPRLRFGFRDQPFPALFMMGDGHVSTGYMKLIATPVSPMVRLDAPLIGISFPFRNARRHRLSRRSAALREARQLPHVLLPRALLRRRARRLGGAAAAPLLFAGPPSSMARLSRSNTQPSRELSYSTPLSQPLCDPVRLFCSCEPD